jgi:hypothetical protein
MGARGFYQEAAGAAPALQSENSIRRGRRTMRTHLLLGIAIGLAPLVAEAQFYRCVGKDGKKYYGQTMPGACLGEPMEELNSQGMVVRRIDPEAEQKMRAAEEANAIKKREDELLAREQFRRNRALLATYTNEAEIDDARKRALADNTRALRQAEARMAQIRKRQAGYEKEMKFYENGGKGTGKPGGAPPSKLAEDIRAVEREIELQETLIENRRKEARTINEKYDQDKKRFVELTRPR